MEALSTSEVQGNSSFPGWTFLSSRGGWQSFTHGPFSISKPARSSQILMLSSPRVSLLYPPLFAFSRVFTLCRDCVSGTLIETFRYTCNLKTLLMWHSSDEGFTKWCFGSMSATSSSILTVWIGTCGLARGLLQETWFLMLQCWGGDFSRSREGLVGGHWKNPLLGTGAHSLNEFGVVNVGFYDIRLHSVFSLSWVCFSSPFLFYHVLMHMRSHQAKPMCLLDLNI